MGGASSVARVRPSLGIKMHGTDTFFNINSPVNKVSKSYMESPYLKLKF